MNAISSYNHAVNLLSFNNFVELYPAALAINPVPARLARIAEPVPEYGHSLGIVVQSWRSMLEELIEAGCSITKVSYLTGISRRSIQRWFQSEEEIPSHYKLFTAVLALYCYYKQTGKCDA